MSLKVHSVYVKEEPCPGTQGHLDARPGSAEALLCVLGQLTQPLWASVALSIDEGY